MHSEGAIRWFGAQRIARLNKEGWTESKEDVKQLVGASCPPASPALLPLCHAAMLFLSLAKWRFVRRPMPRPVFRTLGGPYGRR